MPLDGADAYAHLWRFENGVCERGRKEGAPNGGVERSVGADETRLRDIGRPSVSGTFRTHTYTHGACYLPP